MVKVISAAILIFLLAFTGAAFAQNVAAEVPIDQLAEPVYKALTSGNYLVAAALAVVLITAILRRYLAPKVAWLRSDLGGASLALAASFSGALATSLGAGEGLSLGLVGAAAKIAFIAAGGYALAKKLLAPLIERLRDRLPVWARPIMDVLLWIFDRKFATSAAVARSEKAGELAVKVNPAKGLPVKIKEVE